MSFDETMVMSFLGGQFPSIRNWRKSPCWIGGRVWDDVPNSCVACVLHADGSCPAPPSHLTQTEWVLSSGVLANV